jgi:hypothetical protein
LTILSPPAGCRQLGVPAGRQLSARSVGSYVGPERRRAAASNASGTIVRLQRFDDTLSPDGQWAYVTDPFPGAPFLGLERSGVSELLALSNGELVVLERSFSSAGFRARIYQVYLAGATDTSALTGLESDPFAPVGKTPLWELAGVAENFEGMSLGPSSTRETGTCSSSRTAAVAPPQALYPLRITPAPASSLQLVAGLFVLSRRRARRARAFPRPGPTRAESAETASCIRSRTRCFRS